MVLLEDESLDFSFSGLKSAALREIQSSRSEYGILSDGDRTRICFEYRETITRILIEKLLRASQKHQTNNIYLVGGVSANIRLKSLLDER